MSLALNSLNSFIVCFCLSNVFLISDGNQRNSQYIDLASLKSLKRTVTVSGLNSGGGLAQQLLISHPSLLRGIAVYQQTFYRCGYGDGDLDSFDNLCTKLGNYSTEQMYPTSSAIEDIERYAKEGIIEGTEKLKGKRLYNYVGLSNFILSPESQLGLIKVFEPFIQDPSRIRTRVQDAGFILPTKNRNGSECSDPYGDKDKFYIGNCHLDVPYEALQFLLGDFMQEPEDMMLVPHADFYFVKVYSKQRLRLQPLREFNQSLFTSEISNQNHSMSSTGFIYVPSRCSQTKRCHVHLYLHGCLSGSEFLGTKHIEQSGYLEIGEANDVIMVFPQVHSNSKNDIGCWDSFGYSGPYYATQKGAQVEALKNIIQTLTKS